MAPKKTEPDVYVATQSGSADVNGEIVIFVAGVTHVRAGHAILKQVPQFFEPANQVLAYDVENAAAAPDPVGERSKL